MRVSLPLRSFTAELTLPPDIEILGIEEPEPLKDVGAAVRDAFAKPIGSATLSELCRDTRKRSACPSVVVVVSDNTRPAPYRGPDGILWPLVESLLAQGFVPENVTVLVATGTHRPLADGELRGLVDERVHGSGVRLVCHDAGDSDSLVSVGTTNGGVGIFMNREYVGADLKILTGVVESHFMAGASGGRKSVCPGLLNVESVRQFHGPSLLADERVADLVLDGNPCHELSLEVARMVPADFILNVTIRRDGRPVGVFAGEMEAAHRAAVGHLRSYAQLRIDHDYDAVVTHGGAVGVNHYQAAKAACAAARAVRPGGYLVVLADTVEPDPLGTRQYRRMLRLLGEVGPAEFARVIRADDWEFVHDQWEVQMWAKLLDRVPLRNLFYFSPQTVTADYDILPCVDPASLLSRTSGTAAELAEEFVEAALARITMESRAALGREPTVAFLADGPHSIPTMVSQVTENRPIAASPSTLPGRGSAPDGRS